VICATGKRQSFKGIWPVQTNVQPVLIIFVEGLQRQSYGFYHNFTWLPQMSRILIINRGSILLGVNLSIGPNKLHKTNEPFWRG
jgi:hypothetical protein